MCLDSKADTKFSSAKKGRRRYYGIAGRYVFEFSRYSLSCHVLIGNRLLFLFLLILGRGGGLESCPQRGSETRYIKQGQSRLKSSPPNPSRLDRLVVDSWREHSRVLTLLERMTKVQGAPQHPGISATFQGWQEAVLVLAELRRGAVGEVSSFY